MTTSDLLGQDKVPWRSDAELEARGRAFVAEVRPTRFARVLEEPGSWASPAELWAACASASPIEALARYGRDPARNRLRTGEVQSQKGHSLVLVEGLMALRGEDVGWFAGRTVPDAPVDPEQLRQVAAMVAEIDAEAFRSLLLAGIFHDCGKLVGDVSGVDAENAVALMGPILEEVTTVRSDVVLDVVEFHDLVRHWTSPGLEAFILDNTTTERSLLGVGLTSIQVAGRASLGEGRLDGSTVERMLDLCARWADPGPVVAGAVEIRHGAGGVVTTVPVSGESTHTVIVDETDGPIGADRTIRLLNGRRCTFTRGAGVG